MRWGVSLPGKYRGAAEPSEAGAFGKAGDNSVSVSVRVIILRS